ncbi:hypothetical protein IWT25_00591 [Secundilactobacillus pentosiphilus]|uniref:DUF2334 domain-containing protein n=1 Tax=Secundilactobacillus pentosiphilus TaxID=1714682 RepID=A0A1Z5IU51_9LACO|nr:hypothetical protein [Secundilactobacillus pentosiphilus]GAX05287.1 hypothetical protein IWT25_00591 [Secundilactobacillus pentosiphilus]
MRLKNSFLCLLIVVVMALVLGKTTVQAETVDQRPVMLVYDSKNIANHGDLNLDRCQRLLASLGLPVETIPLSHYQANTLKDGQYQGVITMVNWGQSRNRNQAFERDRTAFKGIKLHIGPGLQADERQGLGGTFKTLVHQQLSGHQGRAVQPLSTNQLLLVNVKHAANALSVGWLTSQNHPGTTYSFGVKVANNGFLPELSSDGLAITLAGQLITKLFKVPTRLQSPLLTITGITPYTKSRDLSRLIKQLSSRGTPFALSITSVDRNTDLKAFHRYTEVLRLAEKAGGLIFLRPPIETGTQRLNEKKLRSVFQTELTSLGADRVIPAGISAPGYWNRSERRQKAVLSRASHVILLPDQSQRLEELPVEPEPAVTNSHRFKAGLIGIPLASLDTVAYRSKIKFVQPTALLVKMPESRTKVDQLVQHLQDSKLQWFDPVRNHLKTTVKVGSVLYGYHSGQYFLNHEPITDLDASRKASSRNDDRITQTSWLNRVIQWQSRMLLWLLSFLGLILAILLLIGWRVYQRKFMRSDVKKGGINHFK